MTGHVQLTLVDHHGEEHLLEVDIGQSVMEAAVIKGIPGILADCGGSPQCGTCSVFVPEEWHAATGEPDDLEVSVLHFNNKQDANRRLSCQLIARADWDGLTLIIPARQY